MVLINILHNLITEGRVEDARKKYEGIPDYIFNLMVDGDPSSNHKYLNWMCKTIQSMRLGSDDLVIDMIDAVKTHHEINDKIQNKHGEKCDIKHPKDINSYKSVEKLKCVNLTAKTDVLSKKSISPSDSEKVFEDDTFVIYIPKSKEASCILGKGTRWCISSTDNNRFESYDKDNIFFIIKHKHKTPFDPNTKTGDPWSKVATQFNTTSGNITFWDANDDSYLQLPPDFGTPAQKGVIIDIIDDYSERMTEEKKQDRINKFVSDTTPKITDFGYLYPELTDEEKKKVLTNFVKYKLTWLNDIRILTGIKTLFTDKELRKLFKNITPINGLTDNAKNLVLKYSGELNKFKGSSYYFFISDKKAKNMERFVKLTPSEFNDHGNLSMMKMRSRINMMDVWGIKTEEGLLDEYVGLTGKEIPKDILNLIDENKIKV